MSSPRGFEGHLRKWLFYRNINVSLTTIIELCGKRRENGSVSSYCFYNRFCLHFSIYFSIIYHKDFSLEKTFSEL